MKKILVVLAAGIGSRFGGVKQVARVGINGETLLDYTIKDAINAGFTDVVYVIRRDIESDFCQIIGNTYEGAIQTHYAYQEIDASRIKPWGTGHALLCALPLLDAPCLVINADDYYGKDSMRKAAERFELNTSETFGLIGYVLENTLSENGGVNRGVCQVVDGKLKSINETLGIVHTDEGLVAASGERVDGKAIVSMNFWMFRPSSLQFLSTEFEKWKISAGEKSEYYLPSYYTYLIQSGYDCDVLVAKDKRFGVTYKEDLETIKNGLNLSV